MNMKKKTFVVAVLAIIFAIFGSETLAYFTAQDVAHNVITSGAVEIAVVEKQLVDGKLQDYPDAEISVMPGTTVSKIVTVENYDAESWIRAKFDLTFTFAGDADITPDESLITIDVDGTKWVRKDGDSEWWYYVDSVTTGSSTEAFFTEVSFDGPNMGNEYQNCEVAVVVTAQAVQKANNGATVLEAAGWAES